MTGLQFSGPAISVHRVTKSFLNGPVTPSLVLNGISFSILQGEMIGIFGPSGCGKSTLVRILCGVLPFDDGEIRVFGNPVADNRGTVAYVPQRSGLLPWKTLIDNALLGWTIVRRQRPDAYTITQAEILFDRFGLKHMALRYPQECSGGESQRVAFIRALLTPDTILLALDEPVVAIDHITRVKIYETLLEIVQERSASERPLTVLMISHDPEELLLLCDRIVVLTQRPSRILEMFQVPFGRPRKGVLRFDPNFVEAKRSLWNLLP